MELNAMEHANITHPRPNHRNLSLCSPSQVHEDCDDYTTDSEGGSNPADTLLTLADHITERLTSAEALALILKSAEQPPGHAVKVTAMIILDLIKEALEANEKVWEQAHRLIQKAN